MKPPKFGEVVDVRPLPRLLGLLGWGLWIVHIGLPMLGWSFVVISVLPGWPFAVYDLVQMGWKEARWAPVDR